MRWYDSKLDLCLDLTVLSPPDEYAKPRLDEQVEYFARYWAQSIFALLPEAMVTSMLKKYESQFKLDQDQNQAQNQDEIPMPSSFVKWWEGKALCAWLHGNLALDLRPSLEEPEEDTGDRRLHWGVDPEAAAQGRAELSRKITECGGELIETNVARHMFAVVETDPFPAIDLVHFRSIDIMDELGVTPSPIEPKARTFEFCCCWLLGADPFSEEDENVLVDLTKEVVHKSFRAPNLRLFVDRDALAEPYLFVYLESTDIDLMMSTRQILAQMHSEIETLLRELETVIAAEVNNAVRATRKF